CHPHPRWRACVRGESVQRRRRRIHGRRHGRRAGDAGPRGGACARREPARRVDDHRPGGRAARRRPVGSRGSPLRRHRHPRLRGAEAVSRRRRLLQPLRRLQPDGRSHPSAACVVPGDGAAAGRDDRAGHGRVELMSVIDPIWAGVAELSRAFETRALSPVDVVDALLARMKARESLHAYIAIYERDARQAAEAADRAIKSGHRVGPLHGVPIALKDLIDLEGRVTTGGSKVWIDRVSSVTATLAQRLIAAGMIVLGKTHTVEFSMGSFGTNTHLGTPWNPWDLAVHRTPGGSSSGSAVAVAAGLAPVAIGTDTGGSVRLPAA